MTDLVVRSVPGDQLARHGGSVSAWPLRHRLAVEVPADEVGHDAAAPPLADALADAVQQVIAALPDQRVGSERALFAEMRKAGWKVDDYRIRDAVDDLIAHGQVEEYDGPRRAKGYRVTAVEGTTSTEEAS